MEPRILGGRAGTFFGTIIEDQFVAVFNWPLGAALSFILLGVVLLIWPSQARLSGGAIVTMARFLDRLGRFYLGLVLAFLYVPILVIAVMSFNRSKFYQLPIEFTTGWYEKLWSNHEILSAAWSSVWIACTTTVIATTLGTAAAIAFFRYDFRGKTILQALLFPNMSIADNVGFGLRVRK